MILLQTHLGRGAMLAVCAWLALGLAPGRLAAHPHLYFDDAALEQLRDRAGDASERGGWSLSSVHDGLVERADALLAEVFDYEIAVPDEDGNGSVTWSYTLSNSPPPPHPNNERFPTWTILSRQLQDQMELLAYLYAIEGDPRFLRSARQSGAVDVALQVSAWPTWMDPEYPCGEESCLDTAHLSMAVAMVYDLAYDAMTEAERETLRGALIQKGIFRLSTDVVDSGPPHNMGALRAVALAVAGASVTTESGATQHLEKAHRSLVHFIESQGADGGMLEGHLYGDYAMRMIVRAAIVLERKSETLTLSDHPWVASLPRFAGSLMGTDYTQPPIGDTSVVRYWQEPMFVLAAQGNRVAAWLGNLVFGGRPSGWLTFAFAPGDADEEPLPEPGGVIYPDTGYASLRAGFGDAPVLVMKSGPTSHVVGHNHYDHNSYVISAFGEWLASDPGYRDYFNAARRNHSTRTAGHNSLLVDGTISADGTAVGGGQVRLDGGLLRHLWEGAVYSRVIGEAAATYADGLLDRFTRRIYYARPDLFFIFDEVRSPDAHELSLLSHTKRTAAASRRGGADASLPAYVAQGRRGRLTTFALSSVGWQADAPRLRVFPGTDTPEFSEWRTPATRSLSAVTAIVPGATARNAIENPGFEDGLTGWQPRSEEDVVDTSVSHSGDASGRVRRDGDAGYFYSTPIDTAEGRLISGGAWVRASGAGEVTLAPYFMRNGSYIDEPRGAEAAVDVGTLGDWTWVPVLEQPAPAGVDQVRLSMAFDGSGEAHFDDVIFVSTPAMPDDSEPEPVAYPLDPPLGIVVETGRGVDVGLSFLGDARLPADTPLTSASELVTTVETDAVLALFGLDADGRLRRAYLQDGISLRVDGVEHFSAATPGGYDVRVEEEGDCVRVHASQVETLEGAPFFVRVAGVDQVVLDGQNVAFDVDGDGVRFPVDGEAPVCVSEPEDPNDPDDPSDPDELVEAGCGCNTPGSPGPGAAAWIALAALLLRRRRGSTRRSE